MSVSVFDRQRILFRSTFAACVVSGLVLIWGHRFLPISDYPDWVFEGSVVAELLHGEAPASYSFKNYPVPNAGAVALIGILDLVFSPEASGRIVLSLCIVLLALSSTYLLKSLRPDTESPLLLIPLLFLPGTFFFWGELSYIFGLSLFLFYCGYLFRRVYFAKPINWWLVGGASIGLFFCHFLPYATAILVTLVFCVTESRIDLLRPFAISFGPSIGLTIWYAVARLSLRLPDTGWQFWTPHQLAGRVLAAFSPFPEFLPWLGINAPGMKLFALLDLLVTILLAMAVPLCAYLWARGRTRNHGVLACAVVCAFAVIGSGYAFAGVVSPGERFLYPAVWIGLCWLVAADLPREKSRTSKALTGVLVALLACQIVFLQVNVATISYQLSALYSKLRSAKSQTEFCEIYETYIRHSFEQPRRTGLDRFLTNHASVPRLPYYIYLEQKVEAPIFGTGILSYNGHGKDQDLCEPP